jgi:hypothetical protein
MSREVIVRGTWRDIPTIPPIPHAKKYFPEYNSIFGFGGRAFSSVEVIFVVVNWLSSGLFLLSLVVWSSYQLRILEGYAMTTINESD